MISCFKRTLRTQKADTFIIGGGYGCHRAVAEASKFGRTVFAEDENVPEITDYAIDFLSEVSRKYHETSSALGKFGILLESVPTVDLKQVQAKIEFLSKLRFRNLTKDAIRERGSVRIQDSHNVIVKRRNNEEVLYNTNRLILVNGCTDVIPSAYHIDEQTIHSTRSILKLTEIPKHLVIIGSGPTALEIASIWHSFGSKVSICASSNRIGGTEIDHETSKVLMTAMKKRGIAFYLGERPVLRRAGTRIEVATHGRAISADHVYPSPEQKPNTHILSSLAPQIAPNGCLRVTDSHETSVEGVYALGSVAGASSAATAEREAVECIRMMHGMDVRAGRAPPTLLLRTSPPLASVGASEGAARRLGIAPAVGRSHYRANSRARAHLDTDGYVKWVCTPLGRVLGMSAVGTGASAAAREGSVAIARELSISAISGACHPHPTLSECAREAALSVLGTPLHS